MNTHSESINEIAKELPLVQYKNDKFRESYLLEKLFRKKLHGRNKPYSSNAEYFFNKVAYGASDCWYWIGCKNRFGYGTVDTKYFGKSKAHQASWILFNGEIPDDLHVLHKCDVRSCVNPNHLFLGTHQDNMKDMVNKNRNHIPDIKGDKNPMSKLNKDLVLQMRKYRNSSKESYAKIGKKFGYSTMTVYRAITGQSWRNV